MNITFAWVLTSADVDQTLPDTPGAVCCLHWRRTATNEDTGDVVERYGDARLPVPVPGEFVPYDELTQPIVEQWLEDAIGDVGVAEHDEALTANLERLLTPPIINTQLPFAQS